MPRFDVPNPLDQAALFATRNLVSPGWVQHKFGIKRQTVETAGKSPGSRYLLWAFDRAEVRLHRVHEVYVDAGWRADQDDIEEWQGNNPADLLQEARGRYAEFLRGQGELEDAAALTLRRLRAEGGS